MYIPLFFFPISSTGFDLNHEAIVIDIVNVRGRHLAHKSEYEICEGYEVITSQEPNCTVLFSEFCIILHCI